MKKFIGLMPAICLALLACQPDKPEKRDLVPVEPVQNQDDLANSAEVSPLVPSLEAQTEGVPASTEAEIADAPAEGGIPAVEVDQPAKDESSSQQPASNQPASEQAVAEQAAPAQPEADQPAIEQPVAEAPAPEKPATPAADSYEQALADIDIYRADVQPFLAQDNPSGGSDTVWLGDGINALNGERMPTCLNLRSLRKQTKRLANTQDSFEFVHNYYDYWKKMQTSGSIGGSGVFNSFTLGASVSASSDHQVFITKDDLVAIGTFKFLREEQSLYNARPSFAPYFNKMVGKNRGLFRMLCGDRYTQSVALGGSMRIVFNAKKRDNKKYQKDTVEATLNLGFTNIFSINSSMKFSKEQQEILRSYSLSMKCYTSGVKADVCARYNLNTTFDFDADAVSLQGRLNEARQRMAAEVDAGKDLVIVNEKTADYLAPIDQCTLGGDEACPTPESLYYNYRPRVDTAYRILSTLEKMSSICMATDYWKNRCRKVETQLTDAIRKCSQSNAPCEEVRDRTEMDILLSALDPGSFSLWHNPDRKKDIYTAYLKGGDINGPYLSNTFYTFRDIGWGKLNDEATSVEVNLKPGWTVRFWEHIQIDRRGHSLDMRGRDYHRDLKKQGMNDKLSAFELIPPPDLPH